MDTVSRKKRSEVMGRVKGKDTRPEMVVRRMLHGLGYRYRLHAPELPGRPDIVFRQRKKVIFVHGCFWHRHDNCKLARIPKSRVEFWTQKLTQNKERDQRNLQDLVNNGWKVLIIWECELTDIVALKARVQQFLD
ncbi:DNA mismatch endonuclease Vsr [Microbulbifer sp. CAU 1566]|uniref:very short patch repair endonuclease n=1 Tax=Microbulbifer sp. CAU 1566 TaxID=2933269 RepID=UPI002004AE88|nr:DNA mismatch endonuclease Vsr [Microbulbifer sp. CAU 1566]